MSLDEFNLYGKNKLEAIYDSIVDKSFDDSASYDDLSKVFELFNEITAPINGKFKIYSLLKSFIDEHKENAYINDIKKIEQWYYEYVIYNSNLPSRDTFELKFYNLAHYITLYFGINFSIAKISATSGLTKTEAFQYAFSEIIKDTVRASHEQFIRMNGGLE